MNINSINEHWKSYNDNVLPKNAGPTQRLETKRAFFSGFAVALDVMVYEITKLSEDEALEHVKRMQKQIIGFYEAVKLGAA